MLRFKFMETLAIIQHSWQALIAATRRGKDGVERSLRNTTPLRNASRSCTQGESPSPSRDRGLIRHIRVLKRHRKQ